MNSNRKAAWNLHAREMETDAGSQDVLADGEVVFVRLYESLPKSTQRYSTRVLMPGVVTRGPFLRSILFACRERKRLLCSGQVSRWLSMIRSANTTPSFV